MTTAASSAVAVTRAIETLMREDRGRLISALIARLKNFDLAEEALQEALISAVTHWSRNGLPASPQGWLLTVAQRKAIDLIRRKASESAKANTLSLLQGDEAGEEPDMYPDERLRLIFTCCHPALEPKSQIALTLRTIGGLTTAEIARAFLDAEPTMGQRLSRAKAKIAAARIPFAVPGPEDWEARLQSVLAVTYLIFNAGYSAGPQTGRDLAFEAIFLAQLLDRLRPGDAEIEGCLALLLITHARQNARLDANGTSLSLADQDRSLWDHAQIARGLDLLDRAMTRKAPGLYQIKAAIAACHISGPAPDWPQIAALYGSLLRFEPTPVVQLNQAVAIAESGDLDAALALLHTLQPELAAYQPFHAAKAEYLGRKGQNAEALAAYDKAIELAASPADAAFLDQRRQRVRP
jgi:RNA polymerase sigma factor (sigma-70 family)